MKDMDTTKIIVIGLVVMGGFSTLGYYVCMFAGLNPTIEPTISIITGLFSAIGVVTGVAATKAKKPGNGDTANNAEEVNNNVKP